MTIALSINTVLPILPLMPMNTVYAATTKATVGRWNKGANAYEAPSEFSNLLKATKKTEYKVKGKTTKNSTAMKDFEKNANVGPDTKKMAKDLIDDKWVSFKISNVKGVQIKTTNMKIWNPIKADYDTGITRIMTVTDVKTIKSNDVTAGTAYGPGYFFVKLAPHPNVVVYGAKSVTVRFQYLDSNGKLYTFKDEDGKKHELPMAETIKDIDMGQQISYSMKATNSSKKNDTNNAK